MATAKDRLIELIEAYAAAKVSANSTLILLAANALQQFLSTVTIAESASESNDFSSPPSSESAPRRARKGTE